MKKLLIILIVLVIIGFAGYKYVYHDHRNIQEESAEYVLTSTALIQEFSSDPFEAEKKYLNKTIAVTGPVSTSNALSITLSNGVFCQFSDNLSFEPQIGQELKIKGRLIGYDDLLEEIKLDQCTNLN